MLAHRLIPAIVLMATAAVLGASFAVEHIARLQPCILCMIQRGPHVVMLAISLLILLIPHRIAAVRLGLQAISFVALLGAGIAVYHAGIEQSWWGLPGTCTGDAAGTTDLDALMMAIMSSAPASCDKILWSWNGITMAGFNILLSSFLAWLSHLGTRLSWGQERQKMTSSASAEGKADTESDVEGPKERGSDSGPRLDSAQHSAAVLTGQESPAPVLTTEGERI